MPSSYHVLAITALALFLLIIPGTLAVPEIPLDGDIEICRPVYGENLGYFDCRDALARMPSNNNFATYTNSCDAGARNRYLLPLTYESRSIGSQKSNSSPDADEHVVAWLGDCKITVDLASSHVKPGQSPGIRATPMIMRRLAEFLFYKCILGNVGTGGFGTYGLKAPVIPDINVVPNIKSFVTVTLSRPTVDTKPGGTDPAVVDALMDLTDDLRHQTAGAPRMCTSWSMWI